MQDHIILEPLLPPTVLVLLAFVSIVLLALILFMFRRGFVARFLVFTSLWLVLLNPVLVQEKRAPLKDVVALLVDKSASQQLAGRDGLTRDIAEGMRQKLQKLEEFDVKIIESDGRIGEAAANAGGTRLIGALKEHLADVPPERLAGVLLVTDGQIHDVPDPVEATGLSAPTHILLTGEKNERDRRLVIEQVPQYGIVGKPLTLTLRIEDQDYGAGNREQTATLSFSMDGNLVAMRTVAIGETVAVDYTLAHGGLNVLDLSVSAGAHELSLENNRAILTTNGVRDHLRVLLVSGEPHAGERTWRNLLKSDPSVDLIHFTVLRPPEKQDSTPIDELSLIAFPTRELFSQKLEEFDLIIFDRYERRGVLPQVYLGNVARFVENGGGLLAAAGPGFSGPTSLYRTPLAAVLPAQPTGQILKSGFRPQLTEDGRRHPVTATLAEASDPQKWGRWFRLMGSDRLSGKTLMAGPNGMPVMILDHVGEGRVAQLLSDQSWLWARGFEGGGPQAELLRRLAHWLMKEPDLEEEKLSAAMHEGMLQIVRQTMEQTAGPVTITLPSGGSFEQPLSEVAPGRFEALLPAEDIGVYHVRDSGLAAVAAVGRADSLELSDLRASETLLAPLARATGGGIYWLGGGESLPEIRSVARNRHKHGSSWLGLQKNSQYVVEGLRRTPLLPAALALFLAAAAFTLAWYREGR